jgi:hypothetical protein
MAMKPDQPQNETILRTIIAALLEHAPELKLPPHADAGTTWHEVNASVFDLSDMYGARR